MATCPRCGALVKPGRSACWNCWAPLAPEQPPAAVAPPHPAEPAPLREPQPDAAPAVAIIEAPPTDERSAEPAPIAPDDTGVHEPVPILDAPEPIETPEVTSSPEPIIESSPLPVPEPVQEPIIETAPESVAEHEKPKAQRQKSAPQLLLPAQTHRQRDALPSAGLIGLTTLLVLIIAALALLWRFTYTPSTPQTAEPDAAAQRYLTALLLGNSPEQQQLSTETSRGELFPAWLSFDRGRLLGKAMTQGDRAEVSVEITLIPGELPQSSPFQLTAALSRPYTITLVLQREAGGWHVDQQALAQTLRETLLAENPAVTFPEWK